MSVILHSDFSITFSFCIRHCQFNNMCFYVECNHLIKNGISHPTSYENVVNKARKFKQNPHGLKMYLNKFIRKDYLNSIIIKSLNMVFI